MDNKDGSQYDHTSLFPHTATSKPVNSDQPKRVERPISTNDKQPTISIAAHEEVIKATKEQATADINKEVVELRRELNAARTNSIKFLVNVMADFRRNLLSLKSEVIVVQNLTAKLKDGAINQAPNYITGIEEGTEEIVNNIHEMLLDIRDKIEAEKKNLEKQQSSTK